MTDALYLLGRIGSSAVAIPSDCIEAVLQIETVVPVPGAPPCVRGLVSIRSRVLVLIDSAAVVHENQGETARYMAIVMVDAHSYALTLDGVDDVIALPDLEPVPAAMTPGWQPVCRYIADHRGEALLVIDPAALIASAVVSVPLAA